MTDKPTPEPLDLVVRARNGALGASESRALEDALATSASARVAYEVGSALDRASRVRPGDEALLERALERTFAAMPPMRRRPLPRVAAALAATLALASAGAATHQVISWRSASKTHVAPPAGAAERSAPARAPRSARVAVTVETAARPEASAAPAASVLPAPGTERTTAAAAVPPATAASLFRDAGAARRAGDFARARALYVELEQRFPASSEARVSRVSLGKLYLSSGNARAAEAAFAQYLRSGAADLRAEALVGRADALRALGRSAEERSVRQELVRSYPTSVYAKRARERIAELDGSDATRSL